MDPQAERWIQLAEAMLAMGNPEGAIDPLRRVLAEDPGVAVAHSLMAMALYDLKRIHAAKHEASVGLSLAPEDPFAHRAMGIVLLGHRELAAAEEHLGRAIDFEPMAPEGYLALAHLRRAQGRREDARDLLEKAQQLDPESPTVLVELGEVRLDAGDVDGAAALADDVLARYPEQRHALVLKGRVLLRRGEVAEAREHALWALRQDPRDPDGLYLLAGVKARQSRFLGLWWRYNVWMGELGERRSIVVLLGAFVAYRVLTLVLDDLGQSALGDLLSIVWLGVCAYSWVGPARFRKAIEEELDQVELGDDF